MAMSQYLLIPFLVGWTSIYQLFWCSPGAQGFDTLPYRNLLIISFMEYMNYISIPKKYIIYQRYGNRIHEWWLIDDYSRDYDDVNVINSK